MKLTFSILCFFISFTLFSQTKKINKCNHEEWLQEIEETNPEYIKQIRNSFKDFRSGKKSKKRSINITIPVHVIIVHPTGQPIGTGSNHSLAHVQSQIDVLNEDFGRYNSDAGNTPPEFPAANTGIQFCLATVDPNGNPTDGITRYAFDGAFHPNAAAIREETRWPRESYSNIWSAPNLPYLGLASVPNQFSLPSPNNDFIHVDAATFGGPGFATFPNYNLGRTTTHEMGHYLGLFHVWGNSGCGNDDGIDDTPIQDDENFGCPNHPSPSCGNSGDMFMNYMDYVNDNCMNAFTQDQGDYMNLILNTSRASLNGSSFTACATFVPLALNVISQDDPNCTESNDGFILVEASGGTPDYTYSIDGGPFTSNNLFTDLAGGNHFIEVVDLDGNSESVNVFLNTPLPITATVNVLETNDCQNDMNGSIEIQVSGGSNPYTFSLNMGTPQNSNVFDELPNGFYVFNIVDDNGCTFEDVFDFTDSTGISITIDSTVNLVCSNDDMGLIVASAEGGTGPLSYSINGFDYQESGEFTELDGGDYFVYVQDSLGCYDSLGVTITEPDPFFISVSTIDVTCFGYNDGSVMVDAMGGNGGPFQYSFDSITYGDTTMLDSLYAGEYDLYALDSLGCLAIATFDIEEPDEIIVSTDTIVNVECFGDDNGMATISATGGNGDYQFIFQGDTTNTGEFTNLANDTYTVTVIDSVGCEGNLTFEIGLNSTISISVESSEMPSCFGGSDGGIMVSASNTQGGVMYSINGGAFQDSPTFTGLTAGEYQIIVQDSSECNAVIDVDLDQPEMLNLQINVTNNVSCNGGDDGSIDVIISGGTAPYSYTILGEGLDPANLAAGTYILTVSDANGCEISDEFIITEPELLELIITSQEGADCETGMGGTLNIMAQGGTGNYDYELNGTTGVLPSDDGQFDQLVYGRHEAKVTDENNCEAIMDVLITLENNFFAEINSVTDIDCFGETGGALDLFVQGGLGSKTYFLDGNPVDPADLETVAGDHIITITDENDCAIDLPFSIFEPEELVIDEMVYVPEFEHVEVNVSGGVEPYMYSFDGGETFSDDNTTSDFPDGTITVIVEDANGCQVEGITFVDGVNDLAIDWGIKAYPNPFQEELILDLDFPTNINATIEVFDLEGRLVHKISSKKYNSGNNFVKLNLSNFASSIYIVKIASAEGYRYIKVTKM